MKSPEKQKKMIQGGALLRIEGLRNSVKSAERHLLDFILSNPEEAVQSTIRQLESRSGASYATIIRFCKKAGFSGFKALKNSLVQDILVRRENNGVTDVLPIHDKDTIASIIQKTFQHSYKTLGDTENILDVRSLNQAIQKIMAADEILFIGTGTSGVSAQYAFSRFFRIGKQCAAETDPTIYKLKCSLLKKKSVLFAISSSGRSANIVDAARIARENDAAVISLCDFAVSPLTQCSTIKLYTTPRDTTLFLDLDMPLIIGQITIIDILFFCCCRKMGKQAFSLMHRTKQAADREKIKK